MNSIEAKNEYNVTAVEMALRENIQNIESFSWITFDAKRHNPPNVRSSEVLDNSRILDY